MSRRECIKEINEMLKKLNSENLERVYYFISGCAMAFYFKEGRMGKKNGASQDKER